MKKHRIKLFLEKESFNVGCVGTRYTDEERRSLPVGDHLDQIGGILTALRNRYGDALEISIIDPRSIISFVDNIRYNVKNSRPTWVLDGRKIFEGIPSREELENSIDPVMAA